MKGEILVLSQKAAKQTKANEKQNTTNNNNKSEERRKKTFGTRKCA